MREIEVSGDAASVGGGATVSDLLVVEVIGCWDEGDGAAEKAWVLETERRLDAHALPGGWAVLMARGDERARDAFGTNTARLLSVKSKYDPDGVFTATPLPSEARRG